MLGSPSGVFILVPVRKQLRRAVGEGVVEEVGEEVCADELRVAKNSPNATPAQSFQPAIKLRRDVASVAFPLAEAVTEFLCSSSDPISKPPGNQQGNEEPSSGSETVSD